MGAQRFSRVDEKNTVWMFPVTELAYELKQSGVIFRWNINSNELVQALEAL